MDDKYSDVHLYILARGVTRCPTACVARTTASAPAADRTALREHPPPKLFLGGSPSYLHARERTARLLAEKIRPVVEDILALPHVNTYHALVLELIERKVPTQRGGNWQQASTETLLLRLNLTLRR